ncbi:hypothetical protein AMTR_s00044p00196010 [Amborella trichopoda]|uniref:NB-ARC domain-containing protein n=1 Tax=Amborella trichopoda TaxID=13333 RepID=U5DA25_AMBTC|nr:hypothetical protein AMTR_s00044p00196010 [Amborella trichopoda]
MAAPGVSFLLQKLDKLLVDEAQLLSAVKDDIQWIKDALKGMKMFLKNADKKTETNEAVDTWVGQVRDLAYYAEDVLDKFIEIARLQRREFIRRLMSPASFIKEQYIKHEVATKIKRIRARADDIAKRKERLNLQMEGDGGSSSDALIARRAYPQVISSLLEMQTLHHRGETSGTKDIEYLHDKRYLVVLDDVWSEILWEGVENAFPDLHNGSRFIITTRMAEVTSPMYVLSAVYQLERLSKEEAWSLFCKNVFWRENTNSCPSELEEVGRLIVEECDGLPLTIVAIGSTMSKTPKTMHSWEKIRRSLAWELNKNKEDYKISRSKLIRLWVAEGFIKRRGGLTEIEVAKDYIKELLDRSLIQVAKTGFTGQAKVIRVHHVIRKLGLSISEKEIFGTFCDGQNNQFSDRTRLISVQNASSFPIENKLSRLRTFLMFGAVEWSPSYLPQLLSYLRYLRVLNLKGIHVESLSNEVGHLVHLRYLGLRDTGVKKLPKSLENLRSLQTLDLEGFEGELSHGITKLKALTYLNVSQFSVEGIPKGLRFPNGLGD